VSYEKSKKVFRVSEDSVVQWAERNYPEKRVTDFVEAFRRIQTNGFTVTNKLAGMKAFIKIEKQVALDIVDDIPTQHKLKAPRLILAASDEVLACKAPFCCWAAKQRLDYYQECMREGHTPGIGPHGVGVEEFSNWMMGASTQMASNCEEDLLFLDSDGETWDATIRQAGMAAQKAIIFDPAKCDTPAFKKVFELRRVRASSQLGVVIQAGVQRATGEADTDIGNTELNQAATHYIMEKKNFTEAGKKFQSGLGKQWFMAASGDDNIIIARRGYVYKCFGTNDWDEIAKQYEETGRSLGLKLTLNIRRFGAGEFCSKWFYPVPIKGLEGKYALLLGGKIGRVLSKSGWFVDNDKEETLRSAATSQLQDNYHVPFLRQYFQRILELAPTGGKERSSKSRRHKWHCAERHEYDEATWAFVEGKYGLTKQDLQDFEQMLARCVSLPVVVNWPPLARCVKIDSA